jgi:hypothetical protein
MTRTLIVLSFGGILCVAGRTAQSMPAQPLTEERRQLLVDTPNATEVAENEARQDDLRRRVPMAAGAGKIRECNNHAANAIALQPDDPLSLATAARAMCSHYEVELQSALGNANGHPRACEHALRCRRDCWCSRDGAASPVRPPQCVAPVVEFIRAAGTATAALTGPTNAPR